jgi:hypothetical protein
MYFINIFFFLQDSLCNQFHHIHLFQFIHHPHQYLWKLYQRLQKLFLIDYILTFLLNMYPFIILIRIKIKFTVKVCFVSLFIMRQHNRNTIFKCYRSELAKNFID